MKNYKTKRFFAMFLSLVMLVGAIGLPAVATDTQEMASSVAITPVSGGGGVQVPPPTNPQVMPDLRREMAGAAPLYAPLDVGRVVSVVVELASPTTVDLGLVDMTLPAHSETGAALRQLAAEHRMDMVAEQNEVQRQIAELYPDALFRNSYTNLMNGFGAQIPYGLIEAVADLDGVLAVHINESVLPVNAMRYDESGDSFGWVEEEFDMEIIDLGGFDHSSYAELMYELGIPTTGYRFSWIRPLSDIQSWDVMGAREAWDLGFTGAGRVAAVLDTMVLASYEHGSHMIFSYMDPVIAANPPDGFLTREGILQTVRDNQDSLNIFTSNWESWFHWRDPARNGFHLPGMSQRMLDGAFWVSDKVPFNVSYFYGTYEMTIPAHMHGSHVAGSILGNPGPNMVNGQLGLAFDAQLLGMSLYGTTAARADVVLVPEGVSAPPVGTPASDPNLQESDEGGFRAIEDAITLGTHSFNMSFGTDHGFSTMHQILSRSGYQSALNRAQELGIVTTISAGNSQRGSQQLTLVGARTAIHPNQGTIAFPSALFASMSVAASIAHGSRIPNFNLTNMQFANEAGVPVIESVVNSARPDQNPPMEVRDNNPTALGVHFGGQRLRVVDIGYGTVAEIYAAGNLAGTVALITTGDDLIGAQARASAAGAVAAVIANDEDRIIVLTPSRTGQEDDPHGDQISIFVDNSIYNNDTLPVLGMIRSSYAALLSAAISDGPVYVNFASRSVRFGPNPAAFANNGPANFTSWGITDALRLTPDITAPGVSVLSATLTGQNPFSNFAQFSNSSGTSMSSPNANGGLLLIQQSVIERINSGVFGHISDGTIEFSELVNQLAGSTATVHEVNPAVANSFPGRYFSPRRQGSGLIHVGRAVQSNVVLHSGIDYNPFTGESARNKVELFDNIGDQFTFSFVLENFNNASRAFDVSAVLQTDDYVTPAPGAPAGSTRPGLSLGNTPTGAEIRPLSGAIMTVQSVSGGAVIGASAENINRYSTGRGTTRVTVPANSTTIVTIAVDARGAEFDHLTNNVFVNGMFLEGFVWFEAAEDTPIFESVNIPFMGFSDCWLSIPVFDFATVYDDLGGRTPNDLDHPIYWMTAMHATVPGQIETWEGAERYVPREIVLGVNQFTDNDWGGYALFARGATAAVARPGAVGGPSNANTGSQSGLRVNNARAYFAYMRQQGHMHEDFIAFSPDGDGYADMIYANLNLLRNVKAAIVVIRDEQGEIVNVLGPEFDLQQILANYGGHGHRHWVPMHGSRFFRNAGWDGTDFDGNVVPDGIYTYEIRAMVEFEFLNLLDEVTGSLVTNAVGAYIMPDDVLIDAMLTSPTVQYIYFTVSVDTDGPEITESTLQGNRLTVTVNDPSGVQALGVFHDGQLVGDVRLVNAAVHTYVFDLSVLGSNVDPRNLIVQAVDFALNVTTSNVAVAFSGSNPNTLRELLTQQDVVLKTAGNLGIFAHHSPFVIPEGRTLTVASTLNVQGNAELIVEGTLVVREGGRVNNQGGAGGTIIIAPSGVLRNNGHIENVTNSAVMNYGTIVNSARFEVRAGTTLHNCGVVEGTLNIHRNADIIRCADCADPD